MDHRLQAMLPPACKELVQNVYRTAIAEKIDPIDLLFSFAAMMGVTISTAFKPDGRKDVVRIVVEHIETTAAKADELRAFIDMETEGRA
jgi:hypothetical protein